MMPTGSKPSSVSNRFVSQSDLDSHSSKVSPDDDYDPRSLFDRLQAHKEAKDAKHQEMFKLSNQFRGIDEGESDFLAQVEGRRKDEERERIKRERDELESFRAARAGKSSAVEGEREDVVDKVGMGTGIVGEREKRSQGEGGKDEDKMKRAISANSGLGVKKKRKAGTSLLGIVKKKPTTTVPGAKETPLSGTQAPTKTTSTIPK